MRFPYTKYRPKEKHMKHRFLHEKSKDRFAELHSITLLEYKVSDTVAYIKSDGTKPAHAHGHKDEDKLSLSVKSLDHLIIHPGEVFSFGKTMGKAIKHLGYHNHRLSAETRNGLGVIIDSLNVLILQSPLEIKDVHLPNGGASPIVSYSDMDYRFKNNTHQCFQLHVFRAGDFVHAELRSEEEMPFSYRLTEEERGFRKEGKKYYQVSKIYREVVDKHTGETVDKILVLDNRSEVTFDYDLIPKDQIIE